MSTSLTSRTGGVGDRMRRIPRWTVGAGRWAVGAGIVVVLLLRLDTADVASQLRSVNLALALPAIAGLLAMHVIGAATWRLLAARLGDRRLSWRSTLRTYYVAQGLGGLTPGNLGADAYRVYAAPDGLAGWRRSLRPIVVQRITSSVALAVLGGLAAVCLPGSPDLRFTAAAAAVILAIASSLVVLVLRRPPDQGGAASDEPGDGPVSPAAGLTASIAIGLVLGTAFHAGAICLSYLLVLAVSPSAAPGPVLACLAIARLSILVPISPSGLGVQEGALSLLFAQIGLSPETALAAALLNRLALLTTVALGGALLALGGPRPAASPRSSGEQSPVSLG